jgi:hypothetical protein
MIISKNDWHYRFNKTFGSSDFEVKAQNGRYTTCSYIRQFLYSLLRALLALSMFSFLAAFVIWLVGSMIGVPIAIYMGFVFPAKGFLAGSVGLCGAGWLFTGAFLTYLLAEQIGTGLKNKLEAYETKKGLLAQAREDKKKGFCTFVEVV